MRTKRTAPRSVDFEKKHGEVAPKKKAGAKKRKAPEAEEKVTAEEGKAPVATPIKKKKSKVTETKAQKAKSISKKKAKEALAPLPKRSFLLPVSPEVPGPHESASRVNHIRIKQNRFNRSAATTRTMPTSRVLGAVRNQLTGAHGLRKEAKVAIAAVLQENMRDFVLRFLLPQHKAYEKNGKGVTLMPVTVNLAVYHAKGAPLGSMPYVRPQFTALSPEMYRQKVQNKVQRVAEGKKRQVEEEAAEKAAKKAARAAKKSTTT